MFLLIRLLTLSTFAAHAVLGCCLAHGSCLQEQIPSSLDGCDGHGHGCVTRCADRACGDRHLHFALESCDRAEKQAENLEAPAVPAESGHQQHNCEDSRCAFDVGYDNTASTSSISMNLTCVTCAATTCDNLPMVCRSCLRTPTRVRQTLNNRAMLQVWVI